MERQRSPSYPSLSLEESIDLVAKIHKANRTNVISRETAAKDMGYAGLTGRSLTVLASLAQYGLVEKAGKGEIKVSRRAVEILHPVEAAHRDEAILEAANAPALFSALHERFSEGVPSVNALRSYLIQQNFNDVALNQAISAFTETNAFAEKVKESGRTGAAGPLAEESPPRAQVVEEVVTPNELIPTGTAYRTPPAFSDGDLNRANMNIQGDRVVISGIFDVKGLRQLEKKIAGLKALLETDEDEAADEET